VSVLQPSACLAPKNSYSSNAPMAASFLGEIEIFLARGSGGESLAGTSAALMLVF